MRFGIRWSEDRVREVEGQWHGRYLEGLAVLHNLARLAGGELVYTVDGGQLWRPVGTDPTATARFLCGLIAGNLSRYGLPMELTEDPTSAFVVIDRGHRIRIEVAPC